MTHAQHLFPHNYAAPYQTLQLHLGLLKWNFIDNCSRKNKTLPYHIAYQIKAYQTIANSYQTLPNHTIPYHIESNQTIYLGCLWLWHKMVVEGERPLRRQEHIQQAWQITKLKTPRCHENCRVNNAVSLKLQSQSLLCQWHQAVWLLGVDCRVQSTVDAATESVRF